MYAVIAEDSNDIECLKVLIKRLAKDNSISIKGKGYTGCGEMLRKGKTQLHSYEQQGCQKFIICYDKDRDSVQKRYEDVVAKIVKPANLKTSQNLICILIPTQEIEAWILADVKAVSHVFPTWKPNQEFRHPETIESPKEVLTRLSGVDKPRRRYFHTLHNHKILEYVDLELVKKKCPSFVNLANFVEKDEANYPTRISG